MNEPLWAPDAARIDASNLRAFRRYLEARGFRIDAGYEALWRWSLENQAGFWDGVWDWCGVIGDKGGSVLVDEDRMPGARYFPEARLNFAENLLRRRDDSLAVVAWAEDRVRRQMTWRELYDATSRVAQGLRAMGLSPGDRIAGLIPNMPEALIFMMAAASIGAVVSTASPDFGIAGVLDRFQQLEPRVLFVADGYTYAGKRHSTLAKLPGILDGLPTVERTVVVPYLDPSPDLSPLRGGVLLEDFVAPFPAGDIVFERLPFDHPLYILFSSGTTGVPKCILHSAGGVLVQHLKEHRLQCDIKPGDRVFYFTTCGWMMWNWLASVLASEGTVLLYDGSPAFPDEGVLFDFADATSMTLLGTSAKFIDGIRKSGLRPRETHDLASIRAILSTGSPLVDEGFEFVYRNVKEDVHLASVSGGTDLCGCLVGGVPTQPVYLGEIQGPMLGMAIDVFGSVGKPVPAGKGELVCTGPFPTLPLGFLNDTDGSRYHGAYFDRFPGVWCHGDYIERTETGGYVIYGRSDATLNVSGVRIGTAEIYRPVEAMDDVAEALVIAQAWENDTRTILFVRLAEGAVLDDGLEGRIRAKIRSEASPRHVPALILQVGDIPRTKSGKIVELAVRAVVHGEPVRNREALANPEALEEFAGRVELG